VRIGARCCCTPCCCAVAGAVQSHAETVTHTGVSSDLLQVHPGTATEIVICMNCGRKAQAGKFAYHLEKCLGKGRQASGRQTSRRAGT
jgi:hypothetical protein